MLENFIGSVNHCVSPLYHLKAYRRGKLVYRGYSLHPHPTVPRDSFSWAPKYPQKEETDVHGHLVEHALNAFSKVWNADRKGDGVFRIALQLLKSEERGPPRSRASILYLRDAFGAIGILTSMLIGSHPNRGRHDTILQCIKKLRVADRIPGKPAVREHLSENCPQLWWAVKQSRVVEEERAIGTLCRPLANVGNWLVHLDDFQNTRRLLDLGDARQDYFVDIAIWLADLMLMRVVGYDGYYSNRLTGQTEKVPWGDE